MRQASNRFQLPAILDNGVYFGVQVANIAYEQEDVPELDIPALVFRAGYMPHENFGIEGRLGGGTSADDTDFTFGGQDDANFEAEIESFAGIYAVGRYNISDSFAIYGLAGFTSMAIKTTLQSNSFNGSTTEDESGVSFGAGASWGFSDKFQFTLEAMSYLDEDEAKAGAVSLGVQF